MHQDRMAAMLRAQDGKWTTFALLKPFFADWHLSARIRGARGRGSSRECDAWVEGLLRSGQPFGRYGSGGPEMRHPGGSRAILGGLAATLAMSAVIYFGSSMGLPRIEIASVLGSMVGGSWSLGMAIHWMNGALVFSLIYAYLLYPVLPGPPVIKGALWGLALWFVLEAIVMPLTGMGVFATNSPMPGKTVLASFLGHWVYGATLGAMAGSGRCPTCPGGRSCRTLAV